MSGSLAGIPRMERGCDGYADGLKNALHQLDGVGVDSGCVQPRLCWKEEIGVL